MQMPRDFASAPHEAVSSRMSAKSQTHSDSWTQFAVAWNAVKYRFLSCTEHSEVFIQAIKEAGTPGVTPQTEDPWYIQQRELFGFFITGLSTIESLCYGLFAIGSILNPNRFPIIAPEDLRRIDAFSTRDKFAAEFPTEPVTDALNQLVGSQEFKDWREVRHVLVHRGLPSRVIQLTLGGAGPIHGGTTWGYGAWRQGVSVDKDTTVSRRAWLAGAIGDLLNEADDFTSRRL